jgi:hypothetical protein
MLCLNLIISLLFTVTTAFRIDVSSRNTRSTSLSLQKSPYEDIIPFVSEHINYSDQILFLGAHTDFPLQLLREEYGIRKTGFMTIIDSNLKVLKECEAVANTDPIISEYIKKGKVKFIHTDYANMENVCKQSFVDAIVDYGGMDQVLASPNKNDAIQCAQHLQNALRLGNVYVSISTIDNERFKIPFEKGYGWVQELDGEPGIYSYKVVIL